MMRNNQLWRIQKQVALTTGPEAHLVQSNEPGHNLKS